MNVGKLFVSEIGSMLDRVSLLYTAAAYVDNVGVTTSMKVGISVLPYAPSSGTIGSIGIPFGLMSAITTRTENVEPRMARLGRVGDFNKPWGNMYTVGLQAESIRGVMPSFVPFPIASATGINMTTGAGDIVIEAAGDVYIRAKPYYPGTPYIGSLYIGSDQTTTKLNAGGMRPAPGKTSFLGRNIPGYIFQEVAAYNFTTVCDARRKKNLSVVPDDISDALIDALGPVTSYQYIDKDEPDEFHNMFIAQTIVANIDNAGINGRYTADVVRLMVEKEDDDDDKYGPTKTHSTYVLSATAIIPHLVSVARQSKARLAANEADIIGLAGQVNGNDVDILALQATIANLTARIVALEPTPVVV
jgi:hypothetical protein